MAEEEVQVEEGPLAVFKWDQGLFEQITRGFRFPPEWDARYPRQGQTDADAPPGYITLFEDFFLARELPTVGDGVHGEPTIEKFQAFYQLIRNIGFYSFGNRGSAKKILLNPPKSFYYWKIKFFFIREEVIPIAMIFRESDTIEKEELPIPNGADWHLNLVAKPNRIFGENVLVAAQMSDKWPETSYEVLVLKFEDRGMGTPLSSSFSHVWWVYGCAPATIWEPYWYEQIKGNFVYPPAGVFANPPYATEGALLPKTRPLRGVTSAGKEILFLSSKRSVGSSQEDFELMV
ncbi:hypothetical protein HanRHA438_Chr09g0377731 [Helianthus annuus]|uniref:Uncharacterized protein n=1 Tax=Helianthus annuus TaxID=4232 RepID=A0A9K3N6Y3_HELAN|nr:hypothetical protein HanXRQr2_Chr09g0366631 [Helianthus annuus]KAJ0540829.1 hypothetical protein HanHA89_Chr09g0321261 [Helianthus annuus]KAJ0886301.1 hypothetical protein HanRHA438_Chr09g0377731 [Helianthus annuus]